PMYWISAPDSARSVDNLAPAAPLSLAGEQSFSPGGLQLTWDPNSEADLAGYNIYRGTDESFEPGPGNFLVSTPDTASFDGGWSWEAGYCYKVAAVDVHGNESGFAVLSPDMLTGDDPATLPDAAFLSQNWPNPFNPATTIKFGLKNRGHVSLRIFDAAGRLVAVLVDEDRPAGRYEASWNGSDARGARVASGVYFYRLAAGDFVQTRKMVLLR
ncbi:MAG TPA: T9SS type A sorting domain-containing protein, partial [Candidatus Eisenbacteria bacterium]|nr:T9SS type A sorting domain-containing protein [Candidatus Eisenbacteria bacterium]